MANGHSTVETFLKRIFSLQFLGFVVSVIATIIGLLTLLRENGGELTFKVDNVVLKNNASSNYFVITSNDSVDLTHYISLTPTVVNDSKYAAKGISLSATIEGQGCHLLQNKNFSASETEGENTYSYNSSELFAHNVVPQIFKSAMVDKYGGEFTITTKCSCEGMDQLFVYTANVKVVNLSKTYFDSEALLKEHVRQELKGNTSFTTFNLVVINGDSCYRYNNLTADLLLQDAPAKQAASVDTTQVKQEETVEEEAGSWIERVCYHSLLALNGKGTIKDYILGGLFVSLFGACVGTLWSLTFMFDKDEDEDIKSVLKAGFIFGFCFMMFVFYVVSIGNYFSK